MLAIFVLITKSPIFGSCIFGGLGLMHLGINLKVWEILTRFTLNSVNRY